MLKKSITYTNLLGHGEEVTEDHYFHLSKAELVEMQLSEGETYTDKEGNELTGLQAKLQRVVDSEDGKEIIETFKMLLRKSYGQRSKDGNRFIKSDELWQEFEQSEAYSSLFMELVTNAGAAAEFVNGIIPDGLQQEVERLAADRQHPGDTSATPDKPNLPKVAEAPKGIRTLTMAEATQMPVDELQRKLASGEVRLDSSEG